MFCKKCGNQLEDGSLYCDSCGTKQVEDIVQESVAAPKKPENNNSKVIATLLIAAILIGGGFYYYQKQAQEKLAADKAIETQIEDAKKKANEAEKEAAKKEAAKQEAKKKTSGVIIGTKVYMRTGPGQNYDPIGYFERGERVSIISVGAGWYQVKRANGQECWVSQDYCAAD